MLTRLQWQQLAERWLIDAQHLIDDKRWSAAYYLAGYAVECGLKACVLARLARQPEVIFDERKFSDKCWTHDALELVRLADLEAERVADASRNRVLKENWILVKDWTEAARYQNTTHHKAKKLFRAISDNTNGVMRWIRAHW